MAEHIDNTAALMKLDRALGEIRKLDSTLPIHFVQAFLYIARHPGCGQLELIDHLDTTSSSAARICARLSTWERPREPGLGLVEVETAIHDRRARELYVTPKGQKLLNRLLEHLK